MKMDKEILGTSTVERAIARTGRLVPSINKREKEPVWDGFIAVYQNSANTHTNSDWLDDVWVQVKAEEGDTEAETISYRVRTDDLKHFARRKNTVFFVVRIGKNERETVYFHTFTERNTKSILSEHGEKKTVSLSFWRFPTTVKEKEKLFFDIIGGKVVNEESGGSNLFLYNAGMVEFWGRSGELEDLEDFLACPGDFCWWGIAAPDGMGKSRLALEFIQELEEAGTWTALFLRNEDYSALDALVEQYSVPLLLVADDALFHVDELGKWMSKLSAGWTRSEPLRILLLERDEGWQYDSYAWERELYKAGDERLLRGSRFCVPLHLDTLDDESLAALIQDFASALRKREPQIPSFHREEENKLLSMLEDFDPERRPLYAMILTYAFLHDRSSLPMSQEKLLNWLVKRERRRLREAIHSLSVGDGKEDEALFSVCMRLRRIAGAIGQQGELDSSNLVAYCPEELVFLSKQAEDRNLGSAEELLLYLGLLQVSDGCFSLTGFRPEFLAEYELLNWLSICNTPSRVQERAFFFWDVLCNDKILCRFFNRLFSDYALFLQRDPSIWERLLPDGLNLDDRRIAAYSRLLYNGFGHCIDRDQRLRLLRCMESYAAKLFQKDTEEAGIVYKNLGTVYCKMSDYPHALKYDQKALAICEKVYGTEHPGTATCYSSLGTVYYAMGNISKALGYSQKALAIRETVFGSEHPEIAKSCRNLGTVYGTMRDFPTALKYHQKALEIFEKVLGAEHPDTALSYNNVGMLYYSMGDDLHALGYCQKALKISEKVFGSEHPDTAPLFSNVGAIYNAIGDYPQALEYGQKALAICEKTLGTEHLHTAASCNILGDVYNSMGDYPSALESYQKALIIFKKVSGLEHLYAAESYNNLGMVYFEMGNYLQAKEYMQRAVDIRKKKLGAGHPDTQHSQKWLAIIEEKLE